MIGGIPVCDSADVRIREGKREGINVPTHISIAAPDSGLPRDSIVLLEQIRTLDKRRLREHMGRVSGELMNRIDAAIAVSFGLQHTQMV